MYGDLLTRRDPTLVWRYVAAALGLVIIFYFAYQLDMAPHLDRTFAFIAMAAILAIGVVGASAIVQRSVSDDREDERRCPHCGEPLDDRF